jgi:hypothetical protein
MRGSRHAGATSTVSCLLHSDPPPGAMSDSVSVRLRLPVISGVVLLALLTGCASPGSDPDPQVAAEQAASEAGSEVAAPPAVPEEAAASGATVGGPPAGRYVCRQYTTTFAYMTIGADGTYEISGVRGRFAHDAATGVITWDGGSFEEWEWDGRYEHVARSDGDGRPDEHVIRLVSEADGLRIDCFLMADE